MTLLTRLLAGALAGALAGPLCLALVYARDPALELEMERPVDSVARGFFPIERAGDHTFAWTRREASLRLRGLSRDVPWTCLVRFRAPRPPGVSAPLASLGIDGIVAVTRTVGLQFEDVEVPVPPRPADGLLLSLSSSNGFVPGPADRRELALEVDRLSCRPEPGRIVLPPWGAMGAAAAAPAAFGVAAAAVGFSGAWVVAVAGAIAAAQAWPLSTGTAPYTAYSAVALKLALWVPLSTVLALAAGERLRGRTVSTAARTTVLLSAAVVFLRLLVLLHPAKLIGDALFQAHRLEWVLAGRYYFTQPMPSGVQFPYAIGLYIFTIPWTWLTRDYVTLLRVVCVVLQACAGAAVYPLVARYWRDGAAGAIAVACFHLAPLSFWFTGYGNLTNVFAEATALLSVAAAVGWRLGPRDVPQALGLWLVTTLGLLSHISTLTLLPATLAGLSSVAWWKGHAPDRTAARWTVAALAAALVLAVVTYYGHFSDAYRSALRVRAQTAAAAPAGDREAGAAPGAEPAAAQAPEVPLAGRAARMLAVAPTSLGWPLLALAGIGGWRLCVDRRRDRLAFAVVAWTATWLAFTTLTILSPMDPRFLRYAVEFVGRVVHATYPAAIVLAAAGATWAWRRGTLARLAAVVLLMLVLARGWQEWLFWL